MATRRSPPSSTGRNGDVARRRTRVRRRRPRPRRPARIEVRKTYKLYIGGAFPRTESGRSYLVSARRRRRRSRTPAGRRARTCATPSGPRARRSPAGPAKTAMNRGQVLYRVAELMEGRRDQFVAEVAAAEGLRDAGAARGRRPRDRPLGLVRRLGRQDRPGPGLVEPGRRAVLQLHDPGADRRGRRRRARDVVAARPRVAARAAARHRQHGRRCSPRETRPLPAVTLTEVLATSDVPGRRRQRPDRAASRSSSRSWPPTSTSTRSTPGASRTTCGSRRRASSPPTTSSACSRRPTDGQRGPLRLARRPRRRAPRVDRRLPRDEDGLAPDRGLTMAVGTGGGRPRGRPPALSDSGSVERRVFVHASPRIVWATLHDPAATRRALPRAPARAGRRRPGRPPRRPARRAHGSACSATTARVESLEARPRVARSALRVTASGFDSEWRWRLEPVAGGTRVDPRRDVRAVRPLDRDPRPARPGVAGEPGRGAPARPQGARRGRRARGRAATAPREPRRPRRDRRALRRAGGSAGSGRQVPFAGLRRNARALAGGLLLLLAIGLVIPDLAPPPTEPPAVELFRGRIVAFLPPSDDVTAPDVRILILAGPQRGQTIDGYLQGPSGQEDLPRYDVGDEVDRQRLARARLRRSSRSPTCTGSRCWRCCSGCSRWR